jgi:hypothetical protein
MHPKKYALVYGVSMYTHAQAPGVLPNLGFPGVDASDISALLASHDFTILKSRWVDAAGSVILDGINKGLIGSPATNDPTGATSLPDTGPGSAFAPSKANIVADILASSASLGPNDVLLVYFSGHGMMDSALPPSTHQWFVPYGGMMEYIPDSNYYGFPAASIRDDELSSLLAGLPTHRKVLVLDTCNSGGFIGNSLEVSSIPPAYTGTNPGVTPALIAAAVSNYSSFTASPTGLPPSDAMVIAAAGKDESSYEAGPPFNHGIMTYYLLQTAGDADVNRDGSVTALEAFAYVKAGIDKDWNANPGVVAAEQTFEPRISGGPVDFVLF